MGRWGDNIYRRKDGRWEGRYIAMRLPDGKAKYRSVYGRNRTIVKKKLVAAIQALPKESVSSCSLTVKELFAQYLAQADIIAVFKIKAHIHMNETTLNSQKGKHSERRVESHSEEHPVTLP